MRVSWMYAAASMRRNAGGVLVLTLLVGLVGAVVLASLAGSRRTASSFERFRDETLAQDLVIFVPEISDVDIAELRRLPDVEALGIAKQLTTTVTPLRGRRRAGRR